VLGEKQGGVFFFFRFFPSGESESSIENRKQSFGPLFFPREVRASWATDSRGGKGERGQFFFFLSSLPLPPLSQVRGRSFSSNTGLLFIPFPSCSRPDARERMLSGYSPFFFSFSPSSLSGCDSLFLLAEEDPFLLARRMEKKRPLFFSPSPRFRCGVFSSHMRCEIRPRVLFPSPAVEEMEKAASSARGELS